MVWIYSQKVVECSRMNEKGGAGGFVCAEFFEAPESVTGRDFFFRKVSGQESDLAARNFRIFFLTGYCEQVSKLYKIIIL